MANAEMWDYLASEGVTADKPGVTLSVTPSEILPAEGFKRQDVYEMDSGQIVCVGISNNSYFDVKLRWKILTTSDAGTIMDIWHNTDKGNGFLNSFYWDHPTETTHVYTVKFKTNLTTNYIADYGSAHQQVGEITLRVFGRKPVALLAAQ